MPISELFLTEFDQEMANTRKTLERVPGEKWDWKPHPKSGTLGWMASHIATLPNFTVTTIQTAEFEIERSLRDKVDNVSGLLPMFDVQSEKTRRDCRNYRRTVARNLDAEVERQRNLRAAQVQRAAHNVL